VRLLKFSILVAMGTALLVAQLTTSRPAADIVLGGVAFLVYTAIGGVIIFRHDGHLTGWLLSVLGLTIVFADGFSIIPAVPTIVADWVASWVWAAVFALFAALTLTFPSGHRPQGQSRWARLGRLGLWILPVLVVVSALTETLGGPESASQTANRIGFIPSWVGYLGLLLVVLILVGGAVSLVVKRRKATGADRAQLTWVVFGIVVFTIAVALTFVYIFGSIALGQPDPGDSAWIVVFVAMVLFPTSFGVAVLRYRLFEIDRIVSRTLTYTLVVGLLAGSVALAAATIGTRFESPLVVAGTTLTVAAAFHPLRRQVQRIVDLRFNRSHYDTENVMNEFAASLRDRVEEASIANDWQEVVVATMQPASVSVWVRHT
jgi:fumarate reductase subunit D